ncbi:GIY-YIG nuclease family protein [Mycoplasma sp. 2248]|uniref:GIY-YIG nuclease family protein n=1 Tax=Mycoplasma sp. 2248 TaxID=3108528 RepID=UPI002B1D081E|nr:GIY-YIG nuclease family protein [Mycoplasma sp. 2248]MEA4191244.1 GIY-YIG nuclease family protein [Mycoplasma sp. 2248]
MNDDLRISRIKEKIKKTPHKSGIYLWKNELDQVIYIGKAIDLNNRLNQYLNNSINSYKTYKMIDEIYDFDFVTYNTDQEAFLAEKNYIEKYQPKYNIKLLDDKRYPYLKLNINTKDQLEIYKNYVYSKTTDTTFSYGPFSNQHEFKHLLKVLTRFFMYENGLPIKNQAYSVSKYKFDKIIEILKFQNNDFLDKLISLRDKASENWDFELAKEYNDSYHLLKRIKDTQLVELQNIKNIDVHSFIVKDEHISIQSLFYRYGVQTAHNNEINKFNNYYIENVIDYVSDYLERYYSDKDYPDHIILQSEYEQIQLNTKLNNKIIFPKKGLFLEILNLSLLNNNEYLKININDAILKEEINIKTQRELENILNAENEIKNIYLFDNSHWYLENPIGVSVCFSNGKKIHENYRFFNHEEEFKQMSKHSDLELMYLTVFKFVKTFAKPLNIDENDIFIVDGSFEQLKEAKYALKELEFESIKVFGLVKNSKHKTEKLINDKNQIINISQDALFLFTRMQNEVDRYAKSKMKHKYLNKFRESDLNSIPGIGDATVKKLLDYFKTFENVKNASIEELNNVIDKKKSKIIFETYSK